MDLEEIFILTLTRYNLNQPFMSSYEEYKHYPTKEEMISFTEKVNEFYKEYRDYYTTLKVDKVFKVIRK